MPTIHSRPAPALPPLDALRLTPRLPPVSLDDLAVMLELDLMVMGNKQTFAARIKRALHTAYRQGFEHHQSRRSRQS